MTRAKQIIALILPKLFAAPEYLKRRRMPGKKLAEQFHRHKNPHKLYREYSSVGKTHQRWKIGQLVTQWIQPLTPFRAHIALSRDDPVNPVEIAAKVNIIMANDWYPEKK